MSICMMRVMVSVWKDYYSSYIPLIIVANIQIILALKFKINFKK